MKTDKDGTATFKIPSGKSEESYTFLFAFTEAEINKRIDDLKKGKVLGLRIPPKAGQKRLVLKIDKNDRMSNVDGNIQLWSPK